MSFNDYIINKSIADANANSQSFNISANNESIDWLAATTKQEEFTLDDWKNMGVNTDVITFKPKEDYLSDDKVRTYFTDSTTGKFDEAKFEKFYSSAALLYNDLAIEETDVNFVEDVLYKDYFKPPPSKKPTWSISKIPNPDAIKIGVTGINKIEDPTLSKRELAQMNKVVDYKTGKELDWTPNDTSFSLSVFKKPVVMAQWDEDGTHEDINGEIVNHYEGEYKLNSDGKYYYETLGDRRASTKQVLKLWDTMTVDGSFANKFDFMDSDGIDKSIGGTIMKTIATIAPMFIPYVGPVYGVITAGASLSHALTIYSKALVGNFDNKGETWQFLNQAEAYTSGWQSSTSDKGAESIWGLESLGNMTSDVGLQLMQQRAIATKIPQWLGLDKKSSKLMSKYVAENSEVYATKVGGNLADDILKGTVDKSFINMSAGAELSKNLTKASNQYNFIARKGSIFYMSMTSASDTYNSMLDLGFNELNASIGLLMTTSGYYYLMDKLHLGDVALKGLGLDDVSAGYRTTAKKMWSNVQDKVKDVSNPSKIAKIFNKLSIKSADDVVDAINKASNADQFRGILLNAGVESLEEVSEEVMEDSVKLLIGAMNSVATIVGLPGQENKYGLSQLGESNLLERYTMSALGGFFGGSMFKGYELYERKVLGINNLPNNVVRSISRIILDGEYSAFMKEVDKMRKRGTLASKKLSVDMEVNDGKTYFKKAKSDGSDSQNEAMYGLIKSIMHEAHSLLESVHPINEVKDKAFARAAKFSVLDNMGHLTALETDYIALVEEHLRLASEYNTLITTKNVNQDDVKKVKTALDENLQKRNDIIEGKNTEHYISQAEFSVNPVIHRVFVEKVLEEDGTLSKTEDERENQISEAIYDTILRKKSYDLYAAEKENFDLNIVELKPNFETRHNLQSEYYKSLQEVNGVEAISDLLETIDEKFPTANIGKIVLNDAKYRSIDGLGDLIVLLTNTYNDNKSNSDITVINDAIGRTLRLLIETNTKFAEGFNFGFIQRATLTSRKSLNDNAIKFGSKFFINGLGDTEVQTVRAIADKVKNVLTNDTLKSELDSIQNIKSLSTFLLRLIDVNTVGIKAGTTYNSDSLINSIIETDGSSSTVTINKDFLSILKNDITVNTILDSDNKSFFRNNDIFDQEVYDNLSTFNSAYNTKMEISKIKNSAFYKLLAKRLSDSEKKNLLRIIEVFDTDRENLNLSPTDIELIKKISDDSTIIEALIAANVSYPFNKDLTKFQQFSFIDSINEYRKLFDKSELPSIDVETNIDVVQSIDNFKKDLQHILDYNTISNEDKLINHKKAAFVDMKLNFDFLNEVASQLNISVDNDKSEIDEVINRNRYTQEDYKELLLKLTNVEDKIKSAFDDLLKSDRDKVSVIIEGLFKTFDESTNISTDWNTSSTSRNVLEKMSYLYSILGISSTEFNSKIDVAINNGWNYFAPTYMQIQAARYAYTTINDVDYKSIFQTFFESVNTSGETIFNMCLIFGEGGTGKTTITTKLIQKLLNNSSTKILLTAPEKTQLDNLEKLYGDYTNKIVKTKSELFNDIFSSDEYLETISNKIDVDVKTDYFKFTKLPNDIINIKINSAVITNPNNDVELIFIDEVSNYSEFDLKFIKLKYPNAKIIGSGDNIQISKPISFIKSGNPLSVKQDFAEVVSVRTPSMTISLRANNILSKSNQSELRSIIEEGFRTINSEITDDKNVDDWSITERWMSLNPVYHKSDTELNGDYYVEDSDIENSIDDLLNITKDDEKILLVTVKSELISKYGNNNKIIIVGSYVELKGLEAEYCVADAEPEIYGNNQHIRRLYQIRNHYTISSRGKNAVIYNYNYFDYKSTHKNTLSLLLTQEELSKYKGFMEFVYSNTPTTSSTTPTTPSTPSTTPTTPTTQSTPSTAPTTPTTQSTPSTAPTTSTTESTTPTYTQTTQVANPTSNVDNTQANFEESSRSISVVINENNDPKIEVNFTDSNVEYTDTEKNTFKQGEYSNINMSKANLSVDLSGNTISKIGNNDLSLVMTLLGLDTLDMTTVIDDIKKQNFDSPIWQYLLLYNIIARPKTERIKLLDEYSNDNYHQYSKVKELLNKTFNDVKLSNLIIGGEIVLYKENMTGQSYLTTEMLLSKDTSNIKTDSLYNDVFSLRFKLSNNTYINLGNVLVSHEDSLHKKLTTSNLKTGEIKLNSNFDFNLNSKVQYKDKISIRQSYSTSGTSSLLNSSPPFVLTKSKDELETLGINVDKHKSGQGYVLFTTDFHIDVDSNYIEDYLLSQNKNDTRLEAVKGVTLKSPDDVVNLLYDEITLKDKNILSQLTTKNIIVLLSKRFKVLAKKPSSNRSNADTNELKVLGKFFSLLSSILKNTDVTKQLDSDNHIKLNYDIIKNVAVNDKLDVSVLIGEISKKDFRLNKFLESQEVLTHPGIALGLLRWSILKNSDNLTLKDVISNQFDIRINNTVDLDLKAALKTSFKYVLKNGKFSDGVYTNIPVNSNNKKLLAIVNPKMIDTLSREEILLPTIGFNISDIDSTEINNKPVVQQQTQQPSQPQAQQQTQQQTQQPIANTNFSMTDENRMYLEIVKFRTKNRDFLDTSVAMWNNVNNYLDPKYKDIISNSKLKSVFDENGTVVAFIFKDYDDDIGMFNAEGYEYDDITNIIKDLNSGESFEIIDGDITEIKKC